MPSSLSFALTSSRFCSADRVDTFTSARRRQTITLKAVSGSGLLQICCIVSSSSEKLTVTNKLSTSFCRGSTDCASVNVSLFGVPALILIASQALSQHIRHPCSTEDTFSIFQNFLTPSQDHDDKRKKYRMIIIVTSGTFRRFHSVQRIWRTFEQNAWKLCVWNLFLSTEVTGTSDGIVSLAEGCATETCVVSGSCTDISSSVWHQIGSQT